VILRCAPGAAGCIARPRIVDPVDERVPALIARGCFQ
jgi:hypothetical protein